MSDIGIGLFLGAVIGFVAGTIAGIGILSHTRDDMRSGAIKAGVAEWTIDAKTGDRHFKWKSPDESEEQP